MGRKNDEKKQYPVKEILDVKIIDNMRLRFKVKWADYEDTNYSDDKYDTWEDEKDLYCYALLDEFLKDRTDLLPLSMARRKRIRPIQYEVKEILEIENLSDGKRRFKVKWADRGKNKWSNDKHDSWENEEEMNCPDLVEAFLKNQQGSSKARRERRESEDEDSDIPRSRATPKRKKVVIESDDDDDDGDAPRSSRSRSTMDRDEPSTSTPRVRKKKTEVEKLRLTPPPSSTRRDSQEPTKSSPIPEWLKPVKRESVSPDKQKELRSAVTSNLPKRSAAESKRWKKIQEQDKKKHTKATLAKPTSTMPSAGIGGEEGPQLFEELPAKTVKPEMQPGDEVVDDMERMDVFDDLREPRERETSSIEQDEPMEGEGEEGENSPSDESSKDRREVGNSETGTKDEEEKKREESVLRRTEEGEEERTKEAHSHDAKDVKNDENESMGNEDPIPGGSEKKPEAVKLEFDFQSPNAPTGYDQNYTGKIIGIEAFEFDNGKKMPFCRVLFKELRSTQYILASIVEEKDPMEFRSFLRRRFEEREQRRIKKGAAQYRAARDAQLAVEAVRAAEAEAATDRESASGSGLG